MMNPVPPYDGGEDRPAVLDKLAVGCTVERYHWGDRIPRWSTDMAWSWQMLAEQLPGAIVGALLSAPIALWMERRAKRASDISTDRVLMSDKDTQRLVNTLGHALKDAGFEIAFNADGNLVRSFKGSATLTGSGVLRADGTATPPPVYDRVHEQPPEEPTSE